nr:unnamed protein product [Callosobruchus chinensis]
MQCEDVEFGVAAALHGSVSRPLNNLDSALNELGMLATSARSEYLNDMYNKKHLNMLTINTRYVSNVSIGFRVRPITPHTRYKPYKCSKERHRTKSENSDETTVTSPKTDVDCTLDEITQLKKAKSLESIIAETNQRVDLKNINLGKPSEVEVVSKSIQNLKVVE